MNKTNLLLISVLIVTSIKGFIWLYVIPVGEAPDEASHATYVQIVAQYGKLPEAEYNYLVDKQNRFADYSYYRARAAEKPSFEYRYEEMAAWLGELIQRRDSSSSENPFDKAYVYASGDLYRLQLSGDILFPKQFKSSNGSTLSWVLPSKVACINKNAKIRAFSIEKLSKSSPVYLSNTYKLDCRENTPKVLALYSESDSNIELSLTQTADSIILQATGNPDWFSSVFISGDNAALRYTTAAGYPPLYYAVLSSIWLVSDFFSDDFINHFLLIRCASVIFAVLAVLFVFLTIRLLFPQKPLLALFGSIICSFQPMFTFMTSVVNNDSALLFAISFFIWAVIRVNAGRDPQYFCQYILIGLTMVVASLSKAQGIVTLLWFIFAALLIPQMKAGWLRNPWCQIRLLVTSLFVSFAVLVPAYIYLGIGKLHGVPMSSVSFTAYLSLLWQRIAYLVRGFWGNFGWQDIPLSDGWYFAASAFLAFSLLGLIRLFFFTSSREQGGDQERGIARWAVLCILAYFTILCIGEFFSMDKVGLVLQGRYFGMVWPMLTLLAIIGANNLFKTKRTLYSYLFLFATYMVLLNYHSITVVFDRYYA
ncbi:MAG: DUF2142 domain-containing protein [Burkholderiales bacterium]|nr:DUF2142 domain-containing protein [Burkholderiales bacterium]